MTKSVTCLIPFFNESARLPQVLSQLRQVPAITQFILVNDGSTEALPDIDLAPDQFQLISLAQQRGKSQAVLEGLRFCTNATLLLFDADITHLDIPVLNKAISLFLAKPELDQLILKRHNPSLVTRLNRTDTVFAGERLLKKSDLEIVLEQKQLTHYQLETAVNHYMITHHKNSCFIPTPHQNPGKSNKRGFYSGQLQNLTMFWNVFTYHPASYFYQLLFFCRTNVLTMSG